MGITLGLVEASSFPWASWPVAAPLAIGVVLLVPGVADVAMRDVPPGVSGAASGVSGAASGVVNVSRQVGTSVGLAVLGSIGVNAAIASWHTAAQSFVSGYHLAVGIGAACVLAAAAIALLGLATSAGSCAKRAD